MGQTHRKQATGTVTKHSSAVKTLNAYYGQTFFFPPASPGLLWTTETATVDQLELSKAVRTILEKGVGRERKKKEERKQMKKRKEKKTSKKAACFMPDGSTLPSGLIPSETQVG